MQGAYDLVMHNYGPDTWTGSIHIELSDTYSPDQQDKLIRDIQMEVYQKHHVALTTIGVYAINTKDEEIIAAREKVREIVLSHPHITQMHGFYLTTTSNPMVLSFLLR